MKSYNLEVSYSKDKAELKITDGKVEVMYENIQDELDLSNAVASFLNEEGYTQSN